MTAVAVLASGRGTNLMALERAMAAGEVPGTLALVAADREAPALRWAGEQGLATFFADARQIGMAEWERRLLHALDASQADLIVLAGFMRVLSPDFVERFQERIVNVHPSLLPAFPGLDAIGQALSHGVRVTGVTVHFVDRGLDAGPIILQEALAVRQGEPRAELEGRVHAVEHRLLPQAVRLLSLGRLEVRGRIVHILEG